MKKNAFTMIELVFVIVILGILASVAVPRLAASRDDANIAKYKSDISAIRSSIVTTRSQNLMSGNANFPDTEGADANVLFEGVLDYPIKPAVAGQTGWTGGGITTAVDANGDLINGRNYTLTLEGIAISFLYNNDDGVLDCLNENGGNAAAISLCDILRQ